MSTPHQSPFRSPFWRYGMAVLTVLLADLAVEVFVAGSLRPQLGGAALLQLGISVIVGVVAVWLFHAFSTGRERAAAEIARIAAQRQLALDAARLGWWYYDPVARTSNWDDRSSEIFGVAGKTYLNDESVAQLIHPDNLPGLRAKVEAALDPRDPTLFAAEFCIKRPDGAERWIEAHGIASFDGAEADRRAVSFVGTAADVGHLHRRHPARAGGRAGDDRTQASRGGVAVRRVPWPALLRVSLQS